MDGVINLIVTRIDYLLKNNPPTGGVADIVTQGKIKELKSMLNFVKALKEGDGEPVAEFEVYDVKLEIAKRMERIGAFDPGDFSNDAITHNQGVLKGLDSLYKWIAAKEEE